jgi:hypothetical protein
LVAADIACPAACAALPLGPRWNDGSERTERTVKTKTFWLILAIIGVANLVILGVISGRAQPTNAAEKASSMKHEPFRKLSDSEIAGFDASGVAAAILYAEQRCTTPPISPKALNVAQQVRARRPIEIEAKISSYRQYVGDVWCRFMAPRVEHLNVSVN